MVQRVRKAHQSLAHCLPLWGAGKNAVTNLGPALPRPIRFDLIAQQYDQMIKCATAIRTGTASTEAILRRFTRNVSHPTYAAMLEAGRAQKTIFCARYLRIRTSRSVPARPLGPRTEDRGDLVLRRGHELAR